ncbi:hypothetical protein BDR07DRAFT_1432866 [Suillus spraguei]|nr:hypothetical protein BDR07DRAFT_1432866 [Suillus spraguei]
MREAIAAHQNTNANHARGPRDELTAYLTLPLEEVVDIVAWWEQAFSSGGITSTIRRNSLAPFTFSALQLLKAAYKYGHVSAE